MTDLTNMDAGPAGLSPGMRNALDRFFAELGQGFNAYLATRPKLVQIERLNALTDAELAEYGITRDGIPRYVFRDLI